MNKIIKTKHIKKLLGVSRYTSSVKKIEEFLDTYCLPVDRVFVHTITSQSGLVDFKTRRKKEVRKKGSYYKSNKYGQKTLVKSIDYVLCDGKCNNCPSRIKCSLISKEESLWD
jgi:endonuclease III